MAILAGNNNHYLKCKGCAKTIYSVLKEKEVFLKRSEEKQRSVIGRLFSYWTALFHPHQG